MLLLRKEKNNKTGKEPIVNRRRRSLLGELLKFKFSFWDRQLNNECNFFTSLHILKIHEERS